LPHRAAADRARAGQVMIDLPPHHRRFADHGIGKVGRLAVAAFITTVSGVLSAWARLPAWVRASSPAARYGRAAR
jgi:hypothetical protein